MEHWKTNSHCVTVDILSVILENVVESWTERISFKIKEILFGLKNQGFNNDRTFFE